MEVKLITLLATVFVFGLLVFVHELGHFLAAKATGMKVEEFAIGFGPVLYQQRDGETLYSLRLIPLGGFNKIEGMSEEEATDARSFANKSIIARMFVIAAGSAMNFILPVFLFFIVFMANGYEQPLEQAIIGKVVPNAPAAQAGLQAGDKVLKINEKNIANWKELVTVLNANPSNTSLNFTINTQGQEKVVKLTPKYDEQSKRNLIGIMQATEVIKPGLVDSAIMSVKRTYQVTVGMVEGLASMITGRAKAELAGPIGVAQMAGDIARLGIIPLLTFAALLSINLGVINLLPIPVLDGGHLVNLLIEAVRGKAVSGKILYVSQMIGFAILMAIMLLATSKDLGRYNIFG